MELLPETVSPSDSTKKKEKAADFKSDDGDSEKKKKKKAKESKKRKDDDDGQTSADLGDESVSRKSEPSSKKPKIRERSSSDEEGEVVVDGDDDSENLNAVSNFRISAALRERLKSKGIESLFPIQAMTFDIILDGSDLVGRAKTGQVENGKKTLILQGMKTSNVLNPVLANIYHLKRAGGGAIRFTKKNDNIRPFESGGETSLEFFSLKTDCSLFVFGSHSKKRPNNLVLGRTFDNHIYDLIEVGVEDYKSMESFSYDKKFAPRVGSKPFFAFMGEAFETVEEMKHLKEVLLDLFKGEVVENLNLAGLDRAFVCTAVSSNTVSLMHCGIRLKKSGTFIPKIELVEVGPSMNLVVRRHRLPNEDLRKEAMKSASDKPKKKQKNVSGDIIQGRIGKIYVPDQKVGTVAPSYKMKGMKRERRKKNHETKEGSKKQKLNPP